MIERLHGFRDFEPALCAQRNALFQAWRTVAHRFGFEEFDGPILEPLELFTQKSGEEIVEQLFSFTDKGGRAVALRPEMTPTLTRILGEKLATLKRPIKWFNITEQFRYERPQKGRLRSFYQFNADIVGEASYAADAELIAFAIANFQQFGLTHQQFRVRLSDRQLWMLWLQGLEIKDPMKITRLLALFDKWERRPADAIRSDLQNLLAQADAFFDATEALRQAHTLTEIRGCFQQYAPTVCKCLEQRLQEWQQLLDELEALGCTPFVTIDLTIVRGLAYYTGFVFELFAIDAQGHQGRALAGGGRYDQLFEKLTGHPMPAAGFAIGDVTTLDLLQKQNLLPPYRPTIDVILAFEPSDRANGLRCAKELRALGYSVVYSLDVGKALNKQLKRAYAEKPCYLITLMHNAMLQPSAQIKRTADETIHHVALPELSAFMRGLRNEEERRPNVVP